MKLVGLFERKFGKKSKAYWTVGGGGKAAELQAEIPESKLFTTVTIDMFAKITRQCRQCFKKYFGTVKKISSKSNEACVSCPFLIRFIVME